MMHLHDLTPNKQAPANKQTPRSHAFINTSIMMNKQEVLYMQYGWWTGGIMNHT
jgi:hypothetical protein